MKTILAGLLASLVVIAAPAAHAAQLLVNGGFEEGLSGWTVSNYTSVITDPGAPADHLLRFMGPNWRKATISQSFETEAGATYDISFNGGVFGTVMREMRVYMDDAPAGVFTLAPATNGAGFSSFSWAFQGTGGSHTLMFEVSTVRNVAMIVDDVSIVERVMLPDLSAMVPEPSTWAMLILGFGAVGASLRNRRRRRRIA